SLHGNRAACMGLHVWGFVVRAAWSVYSLLLSSDDERRSVAASSNVRRRPISLLCSLLKSRSSLIYKASVQEYYGNLRRGITAGGTSLLDAGTNRFCHNL